MPAVQGCPVGRPAAPDRGRLERPLRTETPHPPERSPDAGAGLSPACRRAAGAGRVPGAVPRPGRGDPGRLRGDHRGLRGCDGPARTLRQDETGRDALPGTPATEWDRSRHRDRVGPIGPRRGGHALDGRPGDPRRARRRRAGGGVPGLRPEAPAGGGAEGLAPDLPLGPLSLQAGVPHPRGGVAPQPGLPVRAVLGRPGVVVHDGARRRRRSPRRVALGGRSGAWPGSGTHSASSPKGSRRCTTGAMSTATSSRATC